MYVRGDLHAGWDGIGMVVGWNCGQLICWMGGGLEMVPAGDGHVEWGVDRWVVSTCILCMGMGRYNSGDMDGWTGWLCVDCTEYRGGLDARGDEYVCT